MQLFCFTRCIYRLASFNTAICGDVILQYILMLVIALATQLIVGVAAVIYSDQVCYHSCTHRRSQGVQWVHLHPPPQGGEKNLGVIYGGNL